MLIAYRSDFRTDEELEIAFAMTTTEAAIAFGLQQYGLCVGAPADFVVVAARSVAEAVVARPPRQWVIKAGRPIFHNGQFL
jgi:cytosine deaminase